MPSVCAGMPVTAASVRIGVPIAPKATGAVLAMSDSPAAYSGVKPSPISSAEQIATGVPNPDAPSMNAPNENATSSAWMRRSRRQPPDRCLEDLELPGLDRQAVEKDGVQDDPADRQEAVGRAVERGRARPSGSGMPKTKTDTASAETQADERRADARAIREPRARRAGGRSAAPRRRCSAMALPSGS